jgi:hypothetical protein
MQYRIDQTDPEAGPTHAAAKTFGQVLIDNTREAIKLDPKYKDGEYYALSKVAHRLIISYHPYGPSHRDQRKGQYRLFRD